MLCNFIPNSIWKSYQSPVLADNKKNRKKTGTVETGVIVENAYSRMKWNSRNNQKNFESPTNRYRSRNILLFFCYLFRFMQCDARNYIKTAEKLWDNPLDDNAPGLWIEIIRINAFVDVDKIKFQREVIRNNMRDRENRSSHPISLQ